MLAHYVDTSALVKLIVPEEHSEAMAAWIRRDEPRLVTSDLTRTELARAVARLAPDRQTRVRRVLDGLFLLGLTRAEFDAAGRLPPAALRTLDAVHLAAALALGDDLQSIVTYDERLAEAAALSGVPVLAPGR